MPNLSQFKNKKERNKWYASYREKNREKLRIYNMLAMRRYRKALKEK